MKDIIRMCLIVVGSVAFVLAFCWYAFIAPVYHNKINCEEFWNEPCVVTAVPVSIQPSFSDEYYKNKNRIEQP